MLLSLEYGAPAGAATYSHMIRSMTVTSARSRELLAAFSHHILLKHLLPRTSYRKHQSGTGIRAAGFKDVNMALKTLQAALKLDRAELARKLPDRTQFVSLVATCALAQATSAPCGDQQPGWTTAEVSVTLLESIWCIAQANAVCYYSHCNLSSFESTDRLQASTPYASKPPHHWPSMSEHISL